jgi:hypothetical protein
MPGINSRTTTRDYTPRRNKEIVKRDLRLPCVPSRTRKSAAFDNTEQYKSGAVTKATVVCHKRTRTIAPSGFHQAHELGYNFLSSLINAKHNQSSSD